MIDTHCHLIDPQFSNDLDLVIQRAKNVNIKKIINIGYDLKTSARTIDLNKRFSWIFPAIGIHPNESAEQSLNDLKELENLLTKYKVYAIGETGLDYYRNLGTKDAQQELFRQHIVLARKYSLPLIIHTRNSIDDAIKILIEEDYHQGVFHCYSGTYEQAKKIIDLGFYLGFGGVLTFSKKTRELFQRLPLKRIVLETDAPFLAPAEHRGKRNEPAYLVEILHTAASITGLAIIKVEEITDNNAIKLFMLTNDSA